ncbi:hypothetical protein [Marinobacter salexigens]|uniref:hypothetical protein n=1 Tax=Marinobacter salexigens TaxID=1925763 RepID=UPI000C2849F4|nr:hypothetical protein [Marinobacter salexigens]
MKFMIAAVFIAVAGVLIWHTKQNLNPVEHACAKEIGDLLDASPDAEPQSIANIFKKHGIPQSRTDKVGAMVMAQLKKHGMKSEDARIVMAQVRAAYSLIE